MKAKSPSILIIDKTMGSSFTLMSVISSWGFHASKVNSFLKGVEFCQTSPQSPDLVIVCSDSDGQILREFPEKFKSRTSKDTPIVVYSSIPSIDFQNAMERAGYDDCFIRPMASLVLEEKIKALIMPPKPTVEEKQNNLIHFDPVKDGKAAQLITEIMVTKIDAFGIEGLTIIDLPQGKTFKLKAKILEQVGLEMVEVEVTHTQNESTAHNGMRYPYRFTAQFVNLSTKDILQVSNL